MKRVLCFLLIIAVVLAGCVTIESSLNNTEEDEVIPPVQGEVPANNSSEPAYEVTLLRAPATFDITFADEKLEAVVRSTLGKYDSSVTNVDVAGLTSLDAGSLNITHLNGLEYFVNLKDISLSANKISEIEALADLQGCGRAVYDENDKLLYIYTTLMLSLPHNFITDISCLAGKYAGVDELTLDLSNNQVSNISALLGFTNLISLSLNRNGITGLRPLEGMIKLGKLDLWGNDIVDISALSGLTDLTWVELEQNSISNITAIANLPNLRRVILSFNSIVNVPDLSGMTSLKYLDLKYNQITDDSFLDTLPEGVEVILEGNPII